MIIFVGASGVGKTTLRQWLLEQHATLFTRVVGCTTRQMRKDEQEGRDYYFMSNADFEAYQAANAFVETTIFNNQRYGTLRSELQEKPGILLHICDIAGTEAIRAAFPQCIVVALTPPDDGELLRRLRQRWPGASQDEQVAIRMNLASEIETYIDAQRDTYGFYVIPSDTNAPNAVLTLVGLVDQPPSDVSRTYP
jgi:guanylate kinase